MLDLLPYLDSRDTVNDVDDSCTFHGFTFDSAEVERLLYAMPLNAPSTWRTTLTSDCLDSDISTEPNRSLDREYYNNTPQGHSRGHHLLAENDENRDPRHSKPVISYMKIIAQAILTSSEGRVLLADIYSYVTSRYPYYERCTTAWRNSIRHNLSVNECFVKAGRAPSGRGHYWRVDDRCADNFRRGDFERPRPQPRHQPRPLPRVVPVSVPARSYLRMLTGGKRTAKVFTTSLGYRDETTTTHAAPNHAQFPDYAIPFRYHGNQTGAITNTHHYGTAYENTSTYVQC